MAKIRIVGDSSGYVELSAQNAAGNNTLELPSNATKLVGADVNNTITVGSGATIGSPATNVLTLGTNNAEVVRIDSSGRLGIGTNNPSRKVVIFDSNATVLTINSTSTDGTSFRIQNGSSDKMFMGLAGDFIVNQINNVTDSAIRASGSLLFATGGGTERVRLDSSGNLGIGLTNPSYAVDILRTGSSTGLRIRSTSGGANLALDSVSSAGVYSPQVTFLVDGSNKWAIGGANIGAAPSTAFSLYNYTGATGNVFTVDTNNNFMIGSVNPTGTASQPLQVTGGAYVSGNIGIGLSNPQAKLNISINPGTGGVVSGTTPQGIAINYNDNDGAYGGLWFSNTFGGDQGISGIAGFRTSNYQTDLRFYTNNTNSARSFTERVRIEAGGNLKLSTAGTKILNSSGNPILNQTGSILQVVQVVPSATATSTTGTGANAFNMTTSNSYLVFSGSITPSSTSSKILINFKTAADANYSAGSEEVFAVFRGSTLLAAHSWYRRVQSDEPQTHHILYLDSPGTTSSVQYDIRVATNASYTVYVNRNVNNTSSNFFNNNTQLILMEVAG